jgi:hypothetical protein
MQYGASVSGPPEFSPLSHLSAACLHELTGVVPAPAEGTANDMG